MLVLETIVKIRRDYFFEKTSIKAIAQDWGLSRYTVLTVLRAVAPTLHRARGSPPLPRLGAYRARLDQLLAGNETKARRERLTLVCGFERRQVEGLAGSDDAALRQALAAGMKC